MKSKITLAAAAMVLLTGPLTSQAAPVTVDFTLTSTQSSSANYAAGVTGSGYFTFDDALTPFSGHVGNSIMGWSTLDLAFNWFGVSFDETTAKIATLTFSNGVLTDWWLGGNYTAPVCGLMRYSCIHSAGLAPDFQMLASNNTASLNDGVHSGIGSAVGTLQWSVRATQVPEPATLGMFGAGLLALGLARRKSNRGTAAQRPVHAA